MSKALSYRDAGVDIDAGDALVDAIKPFARRTMRPEVLGGIGGFGELCELPKKYKQPVLVSGTDGVGTKLRLAIETGRHDTPGDEPDFGSLPQATPRDPRSGNQKRADAGNDLRR